MADRLVVDLGEDGRVSVAKQLDGDLLPTAVGESFDLVWPLDGEALEDLRWYLEDYLQAPYGVYEERGPAVAASLVGWGEAVFGSVFPAGPARDAFLQVRAREGVGAEVVLRSESPALLGLPWELMRDPEGSTPLALELEGFGRSLPAGSGSATQVESGKNLRVLMVIARPGGTEDVGYRMIGRPLVRRLKVVSGEVDLVVLRPPTFERFEEVLADAVEAGRPFQVVHFDGHGVLASDRRRSSAGGVAAQFVGESPEGVLFFEKPGGGGDEVSAEQFAGAVRRGEVPLVVLNACQSGALSDEVEAAVATRLLRERAASVVAMRYSVYVVAAAEFMAAFYDRLLSGDRVAEAVAAGRRRMRLQPERPSPKGLLPLDDWIVPVHYLRQEISFPQLKTQPQETKGLLSLDEELDRLRTSSPTQGAGDELAPVDEFVGRDRAFYDLEVAARLQRVLVVHGPGGTGKTELAKAFGRWWQDTGGVDRPEWVLFHSFEPGVASFGLGGAVDAVGLRLLGADFARLGTDERRALVGQLLRERRILMIWDNFESVHSMPDPTGGTPPLDEAGRKELQTFLDRVAAPGGKGAVIITSRATEDWLGEMRRIPLGGLDAYEAAEYAEQLLAPYPEGAAKRTNRAFADLLGWLDGHPLSMRLLLPQLQDTDPGDLLAALQGVGELPAGFEPEAGRTESLGACVKYSLDHLNEQTRRLLPAVSLFRDVADTDVLGLLSDQDGAPERFQEATKDDWEESLGSAADVGLLTRLGSGMYRLHPALPAYLAAQWRTQAPQSYDQEHAAAHNALLVAVAAFGQWLMNQIDSGKANVAVTVLDLQRRTLGELFGYALETGRYAEAQAIVQPLNRYWNLRGHSEEARTWVDRARVILEDTDGIPPALDTSGGNLWLFLTGSQVNRELRAGNLDTTEQTILDLLEVIGSQPETPKQQTRVAISYNQLGIVAQKRGDLDAAEDWSLKSLHIKKELRDRPGMAASYHQLGIVAQERGDLDTAEDWSLKSLHINEELGNKPDMASSYHQLGIVAQKRGDLDTAEDWYLKSLHISEELGNKPDMASSYHQLGTVAEERHDFDAAEDWYVKSLHISEELGNRPGMASSYHQLGIVAEERRDFDTAEDWSLKSLHIEEELGNRPGMAASYHQLGMVAQKRGDLDAAEDWSLKSLHISEDLGNRPHMAMTYGQLGLLAEARGDPVEALRQTIRCIALFEEFPHSLTGPAPTILTRLTHQVGSDTLETLWQEVTHQPLPVVVRDFVDRSAKSTDKRSPADD